LTSGTKGYVRANGLATDTRAWPLWRWPAQVLTHTSTSQQASMQQAAPNQGPVSGATGVLPAGNLQRAGRAGRRTARLPQTADSARTTGRAAWLPCGQRRWRTLSARRRARSRCSPAGPAQASHRRGGRPRRAAAGLRGKPPRPSHDSQTPYRCRGRLHRAARRRTARRVSAGRRGHRPPGGRCGPHASAGRDRKRWMACRLRLGMDAAAPPAAPAPPPAAPPPAAAPDAPP